MRYPIKQGLYLSIIALSLNTAYASGSNFYVRGSVGAAFEHMDISVRNVPAGNTVSLNTSIDTSPNYDIALGWQCKPLRLELASGYITLKGSVKELINSEFAIEDKFSDHNYTYMANVYYDFNTNTSMTPYIGLGLGGISVDDNEYNTFAYQGIVGVDYALDQNLSFTLDYRYLGSKEKQIASDNLTGLKFDAEYKTSLVNLGFKYNF